MIVFFILSFTIGFTVSLILQRLIIKVSKKNKLFDRPESRKLNKEPRARLGGVGIFLGFISSSLVFLSLFNTNSNGILKTLKQSDIIFFFIALFIVFIIGLIDDLFGLNAWQKLPFEIVAATILFFKGFKIEFLSIPTSNGKIIISGIVSYLLTVLWIIIITNAMNLIDGIDGLSGGIAVCAIISFSVMSFINGKLEFSLISVGMIGAVIAFLIYNIYPSKIYMGDSGSLILGFFLGSISLKASTKASLGISFLIPVIILFIPIFDTTLAFIRRVLKKKNPFNADNEHLHHKLMAKGFNEKKVFYTLILWTIILSISGVLSMFMSKSIRLIIFAIVFIFGIVLLFYLRYLGFGFFKRIIKK